MRPHLSIQAPFANKFRFAIDDIPFSEQEDEENFDLSLITSLEADVIPPLGGDRVLDYLITHLAKVLQQGYGSRINHRHQVTYNRQTLLGVARLAVK